MEEEPADGSSVLVPYSGFCSIKWLGVLLRPLDGMHMLVHHRYPPQVALTIRQYPFLLLGGVPNFSLPFVQ